MLNGLARFVENRLQVQEVTSYQGANRWHFGVVSFVPDVWTSVY